MDKTIEARIRLRQQRLTLSGIRKAVSTHLEIGTCYRGKARAALSFINDGFMWLGKTMHYLGEPTPYPNSFNAGSKQIEKSADIDEDAVVPEYDSEIAFIKGSRAALKTICDQITADMVRYEKDANVSRPAEIAIQTAWVRINDALHRLGECLAEIREESEEEHTIQLAPVTEKSFDGTGTNPLSAEELTTKPQLPTSPETDVIDNGAELPTLTLDERASMKPGQGGQSINWKNLLQEYAETSNLVFNGLDQHGGTNPLSTEELTTKPQLPTSPETDVIDNGAELPTLTLDELKKANTPMSQEDWDKLNPQPQTESTTPVNPTENATTTEGGNQPEGAAEHRSESTEVSGTAAPVRGSSDSENGSAAGKPKSTRRRKDSASS
jgi:hypothetical protein